LSLSALLRPPVTSPTPRPLAALRRFCPTFSPPVSPDLQSIRAVRPPVRQQLRPTASPPVSPGLQSTSSARPPVHHRSAWPPVHRLSPASSPPDPPDLLSIISSARPPVHHQLRLTASPPAPPDLQSTSSVPIMTTIRLANMMRCRALCVSGIRRNPEVLGSSNSCLFWFSWFPSLPVSDFTLFIFDGNDHHENSNRIITQETISLRFQWLIMQDETD
jgi:hypothetical protein